MKIIGLVGGTSWTSTIDYYRFINQETNRILGGLNFSNCIIYSLNFELFRKCNADHNWDGTYDLLYDAALHLKDAGAEIIMLGANTAHIVADRIAKNIGLPLVDIRVATASAMRSQHIKKAGLLGTVYTMEMDFYRDKLYELGIDCIIPADRSDRQFMEATLLQELGKGIILPATKARYLRIAHDLMEQGAEGIILGCTEIPLILSQEDIPVPVFNTTRIHAEAAVHLALTPGS